MKIKFSYMMVAIAIILSFLLYKDGLKGLELKLQDLWLQEGRAIDSRIAIIAIDDESLQQIGHWPWNRDTHANLVRILNEGKVAIIGFDVTFPLPAEDAKEDEQFIHAIQSNDNVVLARYGQFASYATEGMIESTALSEPFPALKEAASGLGHLNTIPDQDGIVRKALLQFSYQGEMVQSFSAVIAEKYLEQQGQALTINHKALNRFQQLHIDYVGKPNAFEVIPYTMVLNGDVPPLYFENRIVLVGPYTVGIKDDFLTPMSQKQPMYGVEIHANIIQNLLEGNFKKEVAWQWNMGLLLVAAGIAYFICRMRSSLLSLLLFVLTTGIVLLTSKILYGKGWIISLVYMLTLFTVSYIVSVGFNYFTEQLERKRITSIFGRYVAPQVVTEILENGEEGLKLGGSRKDISVIFVDIRGFTTLSESVEPEEIVGILNEYLNLTANCIFEYGGTLDKFIGDATMAIFNAPLPIENHELQAVKTAWAMKEGAAVLEEKLLERYGKSVKFGIGIHTGPAVVGNIGSKTRMDYTAIGDTVNTAARLESNTKPGQIIISDKVYEKVKNQVVVNPLGEIHVKGKVEGITIYELEGVRR
ncbi:adenylate/guanylate cyclase domain-containing protein [Metasolibacillus meyeri]|uniref:Adenylate/guanylate cyclase domain-containing protein n=1 Tax=Metasolibacillus meyeri TaxID=1071052 RepID=A0AAW9NVN5_9BACL|nr:adenylate/guanylate cyclase domain-containing protein [Metasolibacillus meyeri]MEC1179006.1 adenylate/guanylate cyclase domain-containing protein [Metasolibacillus meyeri]